MVIKNNDVIKVGQRWKLDMENMMPTYQIVTNISGNLVTHHNEEYPELEHTDTKNTFLNIYESEN